MNLNNCCEMYILGTELKLEGFVTSFDVCIRCFLCPLQEISSKELLSTSKFWELDLYVF